MEKIYPLSVYYFEFLTLIVTPQVKTQFKNRLYEVVQ